MDRALLYDLNTVVILVLIHKSLPNARDDCIKWQILSVNFKYILKVDKRYTVS